MDLSPEQKRRRVAAEYETHPDPAKLAEELGWTLGSLRRTASQLGVARRVKNRDGVVYHHGADQKKRISAGVTKRWKDWRDSSCEPA